MHQPTYDLVESPIVMLPAVEAAQDLELVVVTDLHFGAADHLDKLWQRDKSYILGRDPATTRLLILGDLTQMDMKFTKHSGVYQQSLGPEQQVDKAVEELKPLKPYIDLILSGNHDNRVTEAVGLDPCKFIASEIGVRDRYVRDNGVLPYRVGNQANGRDSSPRPFIYTVYAHHGEGVSQSDASLLRGVAKVPNADLYVSGHVHTRKVLYSTAQIIDTRTGKLAYKRRVVASCPSYQGGAGWTTRRNFSDSDWGMSRFTLGSDQRFVRTGDSIG